MKIIPFNTKKFTIPILFVVFIIWMLFFDSNSYLCQINYNQEIEQLENSITFYSKEIKKNKERMENLSVQKNLNNYAREKYHYKKKEEYLYLIEYDTID